MDPAYLESFVNTEHAVLGKALHPFCLEDIFFLSVADSPFLLGTAPGVKYTWADLALAVAICTKRPALSGFAPPSRKEIRALFSTFDLTTECQRFVLYVDDFFTRPEVWTEEGGTPLGADWILSHVVLMMRTFHTPERTVWEMPVGKVLWYCAAAMEQVSTGAQIVSEDEAAGMRALGIA